MVLIATDDTFHIAGEGRVRVKDCVSVNGLICIIKGTMSPAERCDFTTSRQIKTITYLYFICYVWKQKFKLFLKIYLYSRFSANLADFYFITSHYEPHIVRDPLAYIKTNLKKFVKFFEFHAA